MRHHLSPRGMRPVLTALALVCASAVTIPWWAPVPVRAALADPIVFVSRQIPADGSDFMGQSDEDRAMPGVGPRERFRVAAPGRLAVQEPDGRIRVLVDGSAPANASAFLIDVSAPAVSYDGLTIAFAGLPAPPTGESYDTGSHAEPGRWRLYTIRSDGSQLRQITFNDPALDAIDMADYGRAGEPYRYDDTDPAWLPDGRIVFSSTRWIGHGEYGRSRSTNLHVVNADGTGEHRITSERNGADRPLVDPLTGRIVFARWWLNGRFPTDRTDTIRIEDRGGLPAYVMLNGLLSPEFAPLASGGPGTIAANEWIAASVNPDGTDMRLWTGSVRVPNFINNYYGGAFTDAGVLYGNFFPDFPLTESGGFGGIRRYFRGPRGSDEIWGMTTKTDEFVWPGPPPSLTVLRSARGYAADPVPLPDGRLLFSWARNPQTGAEDIGQDYGLFVLDPLNPQQPAPVFDVRGTTELRAQVLRARPVPPVVPDQVLQRPTPTPIRSNAELQRDGTFIFEALNVYFNGPMDMPIVNAPPIGSAATMRFFANYQRSPLNSDMTLNYPVQLDEVPVPPNGLVRHVAPANVPLFEDLRRADRSVPLTTLGDQTVGGAFVAGMNYGRPGTTVRCVGCHIGHSQIPLPPSAEAARWSNLAPGARVTVSSTSGNSGVRLVNRQARIEPGVNHWKSLAGQTAGQWAELEFPVPIVVRTVRLWAPHDGVSVDAATVRLFPDLSRTAAAAAAVSGPVADGGTDVTFADVLTRVVRVEFTTVRGPYTSLAEVEVIASGTGDATPVVAPPSALRVESLVGNTVRLRWMPPPGPAPDSYVLEGGLAPGETFAAVPAGTSPILEVTPPTGRYYVRVRAVAGGIQSGPTNEVRISPGTVDPPSAPQDLLGLVDGNTVSLSWRNTFEGGPLSGLALYANGTLAVTLPPAAERFTYRGVPAGTYSLVLRGLGLSGAPGQSSNAISLTFPGRCAGPPQPPLGLLAYRTGNLVVAMWDPPASGPAHSGYVLDVSGAYTAAIPLADRQVSGTVGPGTYTLRVRAVNVCGTSPSTGPQQVTVP